MDEVPPEVQRERYLELMSTVVGGDDGEEEGKRITKKRVMFIGKHVDALVRLSGSRDDELDVFKFFFRHRDDPKYFFKCVSLEVLRFLIIARFFNPAAPSGRHLFQITKRPELLSVDNKFMKQTEDTIAEVVDDFAKIVWSVLSNDPYMRNVNEKTDKYKSYLRFIVSFMCRSYYMSNDDNIDLPKLDEDNLEKKRREYLNPRSWIVKQNNKHDLSACGQLFQASLVSLNSNVETGIGAKSPKFIDNGNIISVYTCGKYIWLLFHLAAARLEKTNIPRHKNEALQQLTELFNRLELFLGCQVCINNFNRDIKNTFSSRDKDFSNYLVRVHSKVYDHDYKGSRPFVFVDADSLGSFSFDDIVNDYKAFWAVNR